VLEKARNPKLSCGVREMSRPDYDANLVPAPSLTREFEAIPGYHETQVRAAFKARYSKAVEEIVTDIAPTDIRCLFVSTKENFSVRTNQRGSNMQGGLSNGGWCGRRD